MSSVCFLLIVGVLLVGALATQECAVGEFKCSNGMCIFLSQWCDDEYDCVDGSDEQDCFSGNVTTSNDTKKPETGVVEAASYLLSARKSDYGWDDFTARALIALAFADKILPIPEKEKILMTKKLDLQIFLKLMKSENENLAELALNINALYAMCQDPRDFHGMDLVDRLRSGADRAMKSDFNLPIVLLTLCLANEAKKTDFDKLIQMYDNDRNDRIGFKAVTVLAMASCRSQLTPRIKLQVESRVMDFIQHVENDNIDIYSKALAYQACKAWDYDKAAFRKELLNLQNEDGSFGDLLATYSAIPVLLNKSLVNLKCKRNYKARSGRRIFSEDSFGYPKGQIKYSLWIQDGANGASHTLLLSFKANESFYDLMKIAELKHPMYRFMYDEIGEIGKKVYFLGGIPNDAESGRSWTLYRGKSDHITEKSRKDMQQEVRGLEWILPKDGEHFSFWLEENGIL